MPLQMTLRQTRTLTTDVLDGCSRAIADHCKPLSLFPAGNVHRTIRDVDLHTTISIETRASDLMLLPDDEAADLILPFCARSVADLKYSGDYTPGAAPLEMVFRLGGHTTVAIATTADVAREFDADEAESLTLAFTPSSDDFDTAA